MKKVISVLMCLAVILCFAGCGSGGGTEVSSGGDDFITVRNGVPAVINAMEYNLYQNIFYNNTGDDYVGQTVKKTGTFTCLYDRYSEMTRYYVWGYYDQTKCCDWQWEFKPKDTSSLPKNGSLVEMTGVFEKSNAALDGYWFTSPKLSVKQEYTGSTVDVDMTCMSGTLERVQMINIQNHADYFEGKALSFYGRVATNDVIQHPYYDGAFEQKVESAEALPAIGTEVIATGKFISGTVKDCTVSGPANY